MKKVLFTVCLLALFASDVSADCGGRGRRGFFRGRIGQGRILDRVRDRLFGPRHEDKKGDAPCPKCDPKKSGEAEWPEFEGQPEAVPAPRRVGL